MHFLLACSDCCIASRLQLGHDIRVRTIRRLQEQEKGNRQFQTRACMLEGLHISLSPLLQLLP